MSATISAYRTTAVHVYQSQPRGPRDALRVRAEPQPEDGPCVEQTDHDHVRGCVQVPPRPVGDGPVNCHEPGRADQAQPGHYEYVEEHCYPLLSIRSRKSSKWFAMLCRLILSATSLASSTLPAGTAGPRWPACGSPPLLAERSVLLRVEPFSAVVSSSAAIPAHALMSDSLKKLGQRLRRLDRSDTARFGAARASRVTTCASCSFSNAAFQAFRSASSEVRTLLGSRTPVRIRTTRTPPGPQVATQSSQFDGTSRSRIEQQCPHVAQHEVTQPTRVSEKANGVIVMLTLL
jgi:hypothetical protein